MSEEKQLNLGVIPNSFLYRVLGLGLVLTYARIRFGIRVKNNKEVSRMKGPLVCVGNHPSYLDPMVMAAALLGRKINFVAGAFLFRDRFIGPLFAAGGCIPKVQFRSDSRAVKAMITVLKNGGTLGLFPEATRFIDGHSIVIDDALARMVKRTDSGVAFLETNGAYSTWPRWSTNKFRRGRIEGRIKKVLTQEEVMDMSVEQLHAVMMEQLHYNEYDWLRANPRTFKSKAIAAGAENVGYVCPRCEKDNVIKSDKNILYCTACGNKIRMDASGFLHPFSELDRSFDDLHIWKEWEKARMMVRVQEPGFFLEEKTLLLLPKGEYEYREVGEGVVRIEKDQIIYHGTACDLEDGIPYTKKELKAARRKKQGQIVRPSLVNAPVVTKTFSISHIRGISAEYGKRFELIETDGLINRFVIENGQRVLEMQMAIQCLKELAKEQQPKTEASK
jgi:1-acyl-sn-glycerol-3-phosphate acyltransferase